MKILFAAGHVLGAKVYMGYNEDQNMFDLARRKARYAQDKYKVETTTFYVTNTSYTAVQRACEGCDIASFEHSNAEAEPIKGTANRVTVYRTVLNSGDGPCLKIAQATAPILNTVAYPVAHRKNKDGGDYYGVLGRAMKAGCEDAYLIEHGFHTHTPTREKLSDPDVRQQIAVAEVEAMAEYYGWEREDEDMIEYGEKSDNVKLWQQALLDAGFDLGSYGADGSFGPVTRDATNTFKTEVGLLINTPTTVTLVEWYEMQLFQKEKADDGITQEQLDAEKARANKAESELVYVQGELHSTKLDLAGCQTVVADQNADLEGVAVSLITLEKVKTKYGGTPW